MMTDGLTRAKHTDTIRLYASCSLVDERTGNFNTSKRSNELTFGCFSVSICHLSFSAIKPICLTKLEIMKNNEICYQQVLTR